MKLVVLAANMKDIGCVCSSLANTSEELRQSWTLKMELINTWAPRSTIYRPLKGNQGNYNQVCPLAHLTINQFFLSLEQNPNVKLRNICFCHRYHYSIHLRYFCPQASCFSALSSIVVWTILLFGRGLQSDQDPEQHPDLILIGFHGSQCWR